MSMCTVYIHIILCICAPFHVSLHEISDLERMYSIYIVVAHNFHCPFVHMIILLSSMTFYASCALQPYRIDVLRCV